ncbi:MAG: small multi-drug export protein [Planctomycetes bacterium]|nr:small multi-drug export protein [Planctomycetota bacterium]
MSDLPATELHNPFDVTRKERWVVLGLVFGAIVSAIVLGLVFAPEQTRQLSILVPSSFFALGKFLPGVGLYGIPGVLTDCLWTPYELGVVIGVMDSCTVLVIVYSLERLYHVPVLSRLLTKANNNAQLVLRAFPRMRTASIVAIVLFVLFPVSGTGAIGGSFLGAVLGMNRFRIIASVCAGGFLGGLGMAWLFSTFGKAVEQLGNNPYLIALLTVLVLSFFYALARAYKKALAKARAHDDDRGTGSARA